MLKKLSPLIFVILATAAPAQPGPDLILTNGRFRTMNPARPDAEAAACRDGRIIAVGTAADVLALKVPSTRVIDLHGQCVVPGFNDAHVHFLSGSANLSSVQLRDADSEQEFRARLQAFIARIPKERWVTGGDWDHERWSPARLPTRALIDDISPVNPVYVNRLDGHMCLANSVTLKLAGITRDTPDPPGGTIVRDEYGEPTGILKDAAMDAVDRIVPDPSHEEIIEALRAGMRYAAEHGVTSVQDMSASPPVLQAYQDLLAGDELTVRVYAFQPLGTWQRLASVGIRAGFGNDRLKIGGLKGFADGSLGSTTAYFFEPYTDAPATSGLPNEEMIPESRMEQNILHADSAGLQVAIHAIGDRANRIILGMFDNVAKHNGVRDRRFRIEHAQHLQAGDVGDFRRFGVIASMQPYHAIDDGRWADKRLGASRVHGSYVFKSLLESGATLAFGSDWPVAPMDPIMGVYAAVTRSTLDGKHPEGWIPEQKISAADALRAFTMGSAYASFDEKIKGSIEPGKVADMAVLSDDILTVPPGRIREIHVMMTLFNGRVIYDAASGKTR